MKVKVEVGTLTPLDGLLLPVSISVMSGSAGPKVVGSFRHLGPLPRS